MTYAAFAALAWLRFAIQAIRAGCVLVAAVVIVKHLIVRPEGRGVLRWRLFGSADGGTAQAGTGIQTRPFPS